MHAEEIIVVPVVHEEGRIIHLDISVDNRKDGAMISRVTDHYDEEFISPSKFERVVTRWSLTNDLVGPNGDVGHHYLAFPVHDIEALGKDVVHRNPPDIVVGFHR